MKKVFFFVCALIVGTLLFSEKTYADACSITADPPTVPNGFDNSITLTASGCVFQSSPVDYLILAYPTGIEQESDKYSQYSVSTYYPAPYYTISEQGKKLTTRIQFTIASNQTEETWAVKICIDQDPKKCGPDKPLNIKGIATVTIGAALTPTPPSDLPRIYLGVNNNNRCVYQINSEIEITISNAPIGQNTNYVMWWLGADKIIGTYNSQGASDFVVKIPKEKTLETGEKTLCVDINRGGQKRCDPGQQNTKKFEFLQDIPTGTDTTCSRFNVTPTPIGPSPTPPKPPCKIGRTTPQGPQTTNKDLIVICDEVDTALGGLQTDPLLFIKRIFAILLSLSGGVILYLIFTSGYKLMMSQGNAEKVQEAKDTITSAIVGFLFIVFSVVILEIIGVDIFAIPGFGK